MALEHGYETLARYYDAACGAILPRRGDIEFYRSLAEERGGPVLELGCGTGRVLLPVAEAGIECVGIDPSPAMLEVFRGKPGADRVELHCNSMQAFDLGAHRFEVIFAAFRSFQHLLTVDDQLDALTLARAHLAPGGLFAFDVFNPDPSRLAHPEDPEHPAGEFRLGGKLVRQFTRCRRDRCRQVAHVVTRLETWDGETKEQEDRVEMDLRWFHLFELEHLLYRAGFAEVEIFGDFARGPVREDSADLVVVAQ